MKPSSVSRSATPPRTASAGALGGGSSSSCPPARKPGGGGSSGSHRTASAARAEEGLSSEAQLLRVCGWHCEGLEGHWGIPQAVENAQFGRFAMLPSIELPRNAALEVACGRPLKEIVKDTMAMESFGARLGPREEGWVTVRASPPSRRRRSVQQGGSPGAATASASASTAAAAGTTAAGGASRSEEASPPDDASEPGAGPELVAAEVSVYLRPREAAREGYRRLFEKVRVVPLATRCWWRVRRAAQADPAAEVADSGSQLLDAHLQPLSVDGALCGSSAANVLTERVPLKTHQLRSMRWMAQREEDDRDSVELICEWHTSKPLAWELQGGEKRTPLRPLSDLVVEWRIEQAFEVRGGVLADPIGSGKTLTCLVLCQECAGPLAHQLADLEQDLLPLEASLVLCPEQVFHQWVAEAAKFKLRISILPLANLEELARADLPKMARRASQPLVVIVPYSTVSKPEYKKCKSPLTYPLWLQTVRGLRMNVLSSCTARVVGFALEAFAWRRIIFDEFHELQHATGHARDVLHFVRGAATWGVTGTPKDSLRTVESACNSARMFRCDFNTRRSAQEFVERFFRTNEVDLQVQVEWRTKQVRLTQHERLIYEATRRDLLPETPGAQLCVEELARIVRQCSHFAASDAPHQRGRSNMSDAQAAHAFYEERYARLERALHAVETAKGPWLETQLMELEDHPSNRVAERRLHARGGLLPKARLERLLTLRGSIAKAHEPACKAMSSFLYFHEAWNFVTGHNAAREGPSSEWARECAICFGNYAFSAGALLRCGHTFCAACAERVLQSQGRCPFCRAELRGAGGVAYAADLRRLFVPKEEEAEQEAMASGQHPKSQGRYSAYGSKLRCIVETLLEVRGAEPEARILLFVQWADLEAKIASALREFGVEHARLTTCGSVFERRDVLSTFQEGLGPPVLLLSLEQSASGAHLTAATHVLLVHPMVAGTAELARAYEQQAVGRAVRLGQEKRVTVWRFVAADTIEQDLLELLQRSPPTASSSSPGATAAASASSGSIAADVVVESATAASAVPNAGASTARRDAGSPVRSTGGAVAPRAPGAVAAAALEHRGRDDAVGGFHPPPRRRLRSSSRFGLGFF